MKIDKIVIYGEDIKEDVVVEIKNLLLQLTGKHVSVKKEEGILGSIPTEEELYEMLKD
jgi:hypothetical protein